ncbi:MAG: DUF2254 domain-containing protein [Lysobacterales bacterium]
MPVDSGVRPRRSLFKTRGIVIVRITLLKYWERIRSSFWFVPMLMAGGAMALAYASLALDRNVSDNWVLSQNWVYSGGAEGATVMLGTIASSMITIAGVVFSMTLVALSLASSQLGPRLLRRFMGNRTNQMVLGTFVATFLYSLMILRAIRRADEGFFVPHLSVAIGVLLAVASLGVLVYFIHHVAVSIQADDVVARIGAELTEKIDRLFPEGIGKNGSGQANLPETFARDCCPIGAVEDGYVQLMDGDALFTLAVEEDLVLEVKRRPGHFVVKGSPLALVWPGKLVDDRIRREIEDAFVLGSYRSPVQDVEFAVNQLVEIAVRALSPGVNDPFTAVACVDRLGAALSRLAQREMPSPRRYEEDNQLRVVTPVTTFSDVADTAFDQIRQYAASSAAVSIRLLEMIAVVADFAKRSDDRAALRRHAEMIARGSLEGLPEKEDRRAVETRFLAAMQSLEETVPGSLVSRFAGA